MSEPTTDFQAVVHIPRESHPGSQGTMLRYHFGKHVQVSVIRYPGTYGYEYGQWEATALVYNLPQDHPIHETDLSEVHGYLNGEEVNELLHRVNAVMGNEELEESNGKGN